MSTTLRGMLAEASLHLRMLVTPSQESLERPIVWAHSSDLLDPTPWLEPGQLLLTDGTQWQAPVRREDVQSYVDRFVERDITALGFATEIVHAAVPDVLVTACSNAGLALVEVGASTPFVEIIRFVANALAEERTARLRWSLEAQRAIAKSAVRPDGLGEILRTLAAKLDVWVALFDAAGARMALPGLPAVPASLDPALDASVARMLQRGSPAATRIDGPFPASLQTIGAGGSLRGVLAVGTPAQDAAEHDVVVSVIALASIALEQQRALDVTRRRARSAVLELLLAGSIEAAHDVATTMWTALPEPPLTLAVIAGGGPMVLDELEARSVASGGSLFHAERGADVVVLAAGTSVKLLDPLVAAHRLSVGVVGEVRWDGIPAAIERASLAAGSAEAGTMVDFASIANDGLMGMLRASGGALVAERTLAPLDALGATERARLLRYARAWLAANGAWDPAAKSLGIHRHTLRARIEQLGVLLDIDLESFNGRSELWTALELTR